MRGNLKQKKISISPDPVYNSLLVSKFINYTMSDGKKNAASKVVYGALEQAAKTLKNDNPDKLLEDTLSKIAPIVEVKSRRIGGANYQVPVEVKEPRKSSLAMRWLLASAKSVKGKPMATRLAEEIVNVSKGVGPTLKKREDIHRMAEANRAFAHFARF